MTENLKFCKQVLALSLLTIFFVIPQLALHGTNIVTHTYAFGAKQLYTGLNPFVDPQGAGDWFKYSPFFAFLYKPYSDLSRSWQAVVWGITNILIFWFGVSCWFQLKKKDSWWIWAGFLFCSMEADGSFRYQQINAALIGCLLISLKLFQKKYFFAAGFLLALISNIKIIPFLFLFALFVPFNKNYLLGVGSALLTTFLLPLSIISWEHNLLIHQAWFNLLFRDVNNEGLLDIGTVLARYGFSRAHNLTVLPIAFFSAALLFLSRIRWRETMWTHWICLGISCLLLISPRTESPTFVLIGPCYLFLISDFLKSRGVLRYAFLIPLLIAIFLITLCMNDIWPRWIWNAATMRHGNKTFGVLIIWFISVLALSRSLLGDLKSFQILKTSVDEAPSLR